MSLGSHVVHHVAAKFELKSPSVHSVVHGHPTAESESRQAEIRQVRGLTVLKVTCQDNDNSLRSLQKKIQDGIEDRMEGGLGENKLKELQNTWKQEQEEEKK
ncbi:hypothetical protein E2C01_073277 [Portunus trituberculatus]|uniref:Uncharacterized protein n=1 Tax=Portunus trituberculatus TaxID=210409 RepID=A0A5B7IA51_PORTR|nr:hypothetical protein [Portunus trituberculatus]